jgi:hypothetical protein
MNSLECLSTRLSNLPVRCKPTVGSKVDLSAPHVTIKKFSELKFQRLKPETSNPIDRSPPPTVRNNSTLCFQLTIWKKEFNASCDDGSWFGAVYLLNNGGFRSKPEIRKSAKHRWRLRCRQEDLSLLSGAVPAGRAASCHLSGCHFGLKYVVLDLNGGEKW